MRGFRNHEETTLDCSTGTNVLVGDNGQGKTNILEAISYLCLTKSFYANSDSVVVGFGKGQFEVEGRFTSDGSVSSVVRVAYDRQSGEKTYTLNKRHVESLHSVIGRFPVVILSPEHAPITFGAPAERRRFVDLVISQSNSGYVEDILDYRRVLKQRNRILLDWKLGRRQSSELEPWDEELTAFGAKIVSRRQQFVEEFQEYMSSAYHHLTEDNESPHIGYQPSINIDGLSDEKEIREHFMVELQSRRHEDIQFGTTLSGPHRDEFQFLINDTELRKYASQGQHKTFLIALKIGEFFYLKERRHEGPIVLLDDVFSELDEHRTKRVLKFVGELGQTFVTSTVQNMFDEVAELDRRNKKFLVVNGAVAYAEGMASV